MSADQVNAETSKNAILSQFSTVVRKTAYNTENTLTIITYAIASIVFIIVVLVLLVLCSLLYMYKYYSFETVAMFGICTFIIVAILLVIAIESSISSSQRKTSRLADNAINLLSSEQVLVLFNDVARVYNNSMV